MPRPTQPSKMALFFFWWSWGMLTRGQKSEEELLPEGICDGKLGTGSLDHLCPGRDHQPDGGLSLSLHGAPWLGFCQSIPNWQIFVLQAHIPDLS